jgi:hypothetical protein
LPSGKRTSSVQLLLFSGFTSPVLSTYIRFNVFFSFTGIKPALFVVFTISINYRSSYYRDLQGQLKNETANCTIDDSEDKESLEGNPVKYNCAAPKENNSFIEHAEALSDYRLNGGEIISLDEINLSEEAIVGASNLQLQYKGINKLYYLQEAKVETFANYFNIKGIVKDDDYNGNKDDKLILTIYDNTTNPSKEQNINCEITEKSGKNYTIKCEPTSNIKGSLYLSGLLNNDNNKTLIINNTDAYKDIFEFNIENPSKNSTVPIHRDNYRKTSSGLSGGAIAGIVIACAVVLIIASIVAMMVRKPVSPLDNSSSIVDLRTIDNYSQ